MVGTFLSQNYFDKQRVAAYGFPKEFCAPRQFTWMAALTYCTLVLLLGAHVGLEEEHICGGSTSGWQWAAESEQGPCDRSVLSPMDSSPG
jgi:hypothetical protein